MGNWRQRWNWLWLLDADPTPARCNLPVHFIGEQLSATTTFGIIRRKRDVDAAMPAQIARSPGAWLTVRSILWQYRLEIPPQSTRVGNSACSFWWRFSCYVGRSNSWVVAIAGSSTTAVSDFGTLVKAYAGQYFASALSFTYNGGSSVFLHLLGRHQATISTQVSVDIPDLTGVRFFRPDSRRRSKFWHSTTSALSPSHQRTRCWG